MGQQKPRGRNHVYQLGSERVVIHDQNLPETKTEIEWAVAKGWAGAVENKDPGVFDVGTLEKLPEDNHDFSIRTREGNLKYLQLAEFIGEANFHGDYEAAAKQHSVGERFNQVQALIKKKAALYGDVKDVVLLIYTTDFRFNFPIIISVLGTLYYSCPPPFERIYYVLPMQAPKGSAAVSVIHPFRGTLLSEAEIRSRLGGTGRTHGPEDMIYR
jgi:hypothetical protein